MRRILVTGATGTVGRAVLSFLNARDDVDVFAAVRNVDAATDTLPFLGAGQFRTFDFEDADTHGPACRGIDTLFLLRPPQLADVSGVFQPLLERAWEAGIRQVAFLSVQGVESNRFIPHHQIENLIRAKGFTYLFLRPSYFMQNLTGDLLPDIRQRKEIALPAGRAKFNWVDARDVGEAAAVLMADFARYAGQAFDLTGSEQRSFGEVAEILSKTLRTDITYRRENPLRFFFRKRRQGLPAAKILVMIMLHVLPRLQSAPPLSDTYRQLTGKAPTTLTAFVRREMA